MTAKARGVVNVASETPRRETGLHLLGAGIRGSAGKGSRGAAIRRIVPLFLGLLLAPPSRAQSTELTLGASYGALRDKAKHGIANLEADYLVGSGPLGFWGALDLVPGDRAQFLGAGPLLAWSPTSGWLLAASSGPGYYREGNGKDLGYQVEFRSTFYVARRLGKASWLGSSISHYSNAHLRSYNPGAETVRVFWSFPLPW